MKLKFKVKIKTDVDSPEEAERQINRVLEDAKAWAREILNEGRGTSACGPISPLTLNDEPIATASMSYGTG